MSKLLNHTLNKTESCINQTLKKVPMSEIFNLTSINKTPVYFQLFARFLCIIFSSLFDTYQIKIRTNNCSYLYFKVNYFTHIYILLCFIHFYSCKYLKVNKIYTTLPKTIGWLLFNSNLIFKNWLKQ